MRKKIILASSSPRRIEMMQKNGFNPEIRPSNIDEALPQNIEMKDAVMFLALKKALDVESRCVFPDDLGKLIIAADTVVYKDGILGKPENREDAFSMLRRIKGTSHEVATGVAIIEAGCANKIVFYDSTTVFCKNYTDDELNAYLDTNEPYDKAGAYAIQGIFSKHIDHYEGSFDTVVGFPWDIIEEKLKAFAE